MRFWLFWFQETNTNRRTGFLAILYIKDTFGTKFSSVHPHRRSRHNLYLSTHEVRVLTPLSNFRQNTEVQHSHLGKSDLLVHIMSSIGLKISKRIVKHEVGERNWLRINKSLACSTSPLQLLMIIFMDLTGLYTLILPITQFEKFYLKKFRCVQNKISVVEQAKRK